MNSATTLQQALSRLEQSMAARFSAQPAFEQRNLDLPPMPTSMPHRLSTSTSTSTSTLPQLFAIRCPVERPYFRGRTVRIGKRWQGKYRGELLAQDDLAVWMELLYRVGQEHGERVEFSPGNFCKAMGWGATAVDCSRLRQCLLRLQATALEYEDATHLSARSAISLIECCEWQPSPSGRSGRWTVVIAARTQAFYVDVAMHGFSSKIRA